MFFCFFFKTLMLFFFFNQPGSYYVTKTAPVKNTVIPGSKSPHEDTQVCSYVHLKESQKIQLGVSYSWLRKHSKITRRRAHAHTRPTLAKSPPGEEDVIPPGEMDRSGVQVKRHSVTEGQLSR